MRYSVKPITKREKLLYYLLSRVTVDREDLLNRFGKTGYQRMMEIEYLHHLAIKKTRVAGTITYELADLSEGFKLYEKWLTNRQNIQFTYHDIILDWEELGLNYKQIGQLYGYSKAHIGRIIFDYLTAKANKLSLNIKRKSKLQQRLEK